MASVPLRAHLEFVQGLLEALSDPTRELLVALLLRAGPDGIRATQLAESVGLKPTTARHHMRILEQALLVENQVGRDETGIFSRYAATEVARDWFDRLGMENVPQVIAALRQQRRVAA